MLFRSSPFYEESNLMLHRDRREVNAWARHYYSTDPWVNKYIFPNSLIPSAKQIASAAEGWFVLEDWHSFGQYYDRTLMAWYNNFAKNWTKIKDKYDDRFYRMWTYYLLLSAGCFRSRRNQLWQIVFSKKGIKGGYRYRE